MDIKQTREIVAAIMTAAKLGSDDAHGIARDPAIFVREYEGMLAALKDAKYGREPQPPATAADKDGLSLPPRIDNRETIAALRS